MQFYKMLLCDPKGSWTAGTKERNERRRGATEGKDWFKNRNMFVR